MGAWLKARFLFVWAILTELISLSCLGHVSGLSIVPPTDGGNQIVASSVEDMFDQYISKYNRTYVRGSAEYQKRLAAFRDSLSRIEQKNKLRNHSASAVYGVTPFSDFTPDEFQGLLSAFEPASGLLGASGNLDDLNNDNSLGNDNSLSLLTASGSKSRYPPKFDWRNHSVVTPVRNQLDCGACWAFSTVESVESMNAIATGNLVQLSVQQMVDCDVGYR